MQKLICLLILIGFFVCFSRTNAEYDNKVPKLPPYIPSTSDLVSLYASQYGVSEHLMNSIIKCESGGKTDIISKTHDYGIAQIHISSWGFTKQQAFNKDFSIKFLAEQLSKGNGHYWVCYNRLKMV